MNWATGQVLLCKTDLVVLSHQPKETPASLLGSVLANAALAFGTCKCSPATQQNQLQIFPYRRLPVRPWESHIRTEFWKYLNFAILMFLNNADCTCRYQCVRRIMLTPAMQGRAKCVTKTNAYKLWGIQVIHSMDHKIYMHFLLSNSHPRYRTTIAFSQKKMLSFKYVNILTYFLQVCTFCLGFLLLYCNNLSIRCPPHHTH